MYVGLSACAGIHLKCQEKAVKEACHDILSPAKIGFFSSIASVFEQFILVANSCTNDSSFYAEIFNILQILMMCFIKTNVMEEATTPKILIKVEIFSKKFFHELKDMNINVQLIIYLPKELFQQRKN